MTVNLYEVAVRQKFRFPSTKNELTTEQLFDLPLKAANGFDLDSVARTLFRELKDATEESFVADNRDPKTAVLEQKLDLVKLVIETRKAEKEEAAKKAQKASELKRLKEALARREDAELEGLSKADIEKRIADLS